jgi:hypothetical protein
LQIKNTMSNILQKLNGFNKALQDGEFDMDPAAAVALWNTVPPILSRAESYKAELKDAETLKYKLENKVSLFKKNLSQCFCYIYLMVPKF